MARRAIALLGTVLLIVSCATVQVAIDHDPAVDFTRFRTFQLVGGHLMRDGISDDNNTLVQDRIVGALRSALQGKGLHEAGAGAPADLDVGYFAGARTRTEIEAMPAYGPGFGPFWYGGWWDPAYKDWWTRTYNEGTLVIDLVDAQTKRLVWRAYTQTEIHIPVSDEKIREAVGKAFQSFPPHK
jgi:hypothetical protein